MAEIKNCSRTNALVAVAIIWMFTLHAQVLNAALQYGDRCSNDDPSTCSSPNLTCANNLTCVCSQDYARDDSNPSNIVCIKKSGYGEECTPGNFDSCIDTNTTCIPDVNNTNRCICGVNFYRNADGNCRTVSELGAYKVSARSTTNTVTLTWVVDRHGLNVTITIKSNEGQGYLQSVVTDTGATWTNLTAGRKYSFNITTTVPPSSFYPEMTVVVYKGDVWTEPEKPGPVVSVTLVSGAPGTNYLYDVTFQASPGDVTGYSVSVNNQLANETITTTTSRFYTLSPGQNCTYVITAYNGIDNPSVPSVGVFRINVAEPGEVRQLTVTQNGTRAQELNISFLCPNEKALGNIQGYRIQKILLNSAGQQEQNTSYAFVASDTSCGSSYSANQVGGILVDRNYTFSVRAWNENYTGSYTPPLRFYVAPKVPRLLQIYDKSVLLKERTTGILEQTMIEVVLCVSCLLDASQGTVRDVGLVVCVFDGGNSCIDSGIEPLDQYNTWDNARQNNFNVPYRTTSSDWMQSLMSQQSQLAYITYIIGEDDSCTTQPTTTYCNGPLPKEKDLLLIVVQCNDAGCGQVQYLFNTKALPTESPSDPPMGLALGLGLGLGCLLVLIAVAVGVVIFRRKRRSPYSTADPRLIDQHLYWKIGDKTGRSTNPPSHHPVQNKPPGDYIEPVQVPDYFTRPELGGSTHMYSGPDLGGSIHVYSGPEDDIYDYIIDDNISRIGVPNEVQSHATKKGKSSDESERQKD